MHWLSRCFDLARFGAGRVSPNPLVGAVLVFDERIIGEGWHTGFGEPHAEVNAMNAVAAVDRHLIPDSTLFCNLEPCFHTGKTPPCVELILKEKIRRVVISNIDPNPLTGGQSVHKMRSEGIEVLTGVLEQEGFELNRAFFTWVLQKRPYIVLKWAQSADGYLGLEGQTTPISGPLARRLVHRWRSESDAVLVGAVTARTDNPRLDNRLFPGKTPLRIALDRNSRISPGFHLLDDKVPTWILGPARTGNFRNTRFLEYPAENWIQSLLQTLSAENKAILFVEGGAIVHRQFIAAGLADEIRVLRNDIVLGKGIEAPALPPGYRLNSVFTLENDTVEIYRR